MIDTVLKARVGPRFEVTISSPHPEHEVAGVAVTWWTVELRYAASRLLVAGGTGDTFAEACSAAYEDLSEGRRSGREENARAL